VASLERLRKRLRGDGHEQPDRAELSRAARAQGSRNGGGDIDVVPLLAEAQSWLRNLALTSRTAANQLREKAQLAGRRHQSDTDGAIEPLDLIGELVERIDGMQREAERLAVVLDRTQSRLSALPERDGSMEQGSDEDEDSPVRTEQIRALVILLAGAGASRQEIAAWIFRQHGVVVSNHLIDEVALEQGRTLP
jgi:hypothetical protein